MTERRDDCAECGEWLTGRQRLFCSDACRKRSDRYESLCRRTTSEQRNEAARKEIEILRAATARRNSLETRGKAPCPVCGGWVKRGRKRKPGRMPVYCSVACRSRAQRQRQTQTQNTPSEDGTP